MRAGLPTSVRVLSRRKGRCPYTRRPSAQIMVGRDAPFRRDAVAVLVLASPALATPVTNISVTNATPTTAAGGQTNYTVTLKTSTAGTLTGANARIHVTFPTGTTFP